MTICCDWLLQLLAESIACRRRYKEGARRIHGAGRQGPYRDNQSDEPSAEASSEQSVQFVECIDGETCG